MGAASLRRTALTCQIAGLRGDREQSRDKLTSPAKGIEPIKPSYLEVRSLISHEATPVNVFVNSHSGPTNERHLDASRPLQGF